FDCFFFQAEDGIRDFHVTGVQTCALPISDGAQKVEHYTDLSSEAHLLSSAMVLASDATLENGDSTGDPTEIALLQLADDLKIDRSEERRVGKECRYRRAASHQRTEKQETR